MNQNEPNTEPEAEPQEGGLPSTALLSQENKEDMLRELWYKRNPCHDYDQEGKDRFWGTVLCVIEDYQNRLSNLR